MTGIGNDTPVTIAAASVSRESQPEPGPLWGIVVRQKVFLILWFFIAVVSAIDTYLTIEYSAVLVEENPVARCLISVAGVPLLVSVKFFGTSLALGFILSTRSKWFAMPVVSGVAAIQCALLCYLVL